MAAPAAVVVVAVVKARAAASFAPAGPQRLAC
jgi:hypothetical protein